MAYSILGLTLPECCLLSQVEPAILAEPEYTVATYLINTDVFTEEEMRKAIKTLKTTSR